MSFARRLFNYDTEVSAIELKLKPGSNTDAVQKKMERILGDRFVVQNRYEQQADVFRIMEIENSSHICSSPLSLQSPASTLSVLFPC